MQTGKSDLHPIVLMESPETGYWPPLLEFCSNVLVEKGLISPADLISSPSPAIANDAVEHILDFYSNYHSQRYVEGRLVLRIRRAPGPEHLEGLSREFQDMLVSGDIEIVQPSAAEVAEADNARPASASDYISIVGAMAASGC